MSQLANIEEQSSTSLSEQGKTITQLFQDFSGELWHEKLPSHLNVNKPIPLMVFGSLLTP